MKKLFLGIVIGLVIGLGVSAMAAFASYGFWTKVSQYMEKSETYQFGYEQGSWDAFSFIDSTHNRDGWDWDYFRKQMLCWDGESAKAIQMHDYALEAAHRSNRQGYANDNFASILLASACGQ
jgi:hypothetical protein